MTTTPDKYGDRYCIQRWNHREIPDSETINGVLWCATCLNDAKESSV